MQIVFFGKGARGAVCLKRILAGRHQVSLVVGHKLKDPVAQDDVGQVADKAGLPVVRPDDPNEHDVLSLLQKQDADVFVLGGYGHIVKRTLLEIPKKKCINLHAGKLPQYRGSSPLNWALINGESEFGISIIEVDEGVDTGPVLASMILPIHANDTIVELHQKANTYFPDLLENVLDQLQEGTLKTVQQCSAVSSYYPIRFPDDGIIFWDIYSAEQVHNRIRALTKPYPCATTYYGGKKVVLLKSEMTKRPYYGEPGRIYRIKADRILVCARDCCLWVTGASFADTGESIMRIVSRYEAMATIRAAAVHVYEAMSNRV